MRRSSGRGRARKADAWHGRYMATGKAAGSGVRKTDRAAARTMGRSPLYPMSLTDIIPAGDLNKGGYPIFADGSASVRSASAAVRRRRRRHRAPHGRNVGYVEKVSKIAVSVGTAPTPTGRLITRSVMVTSCSRRVRRVAIARPVRWATSRIKRGAASAISHDSHGRRHVARPCAQGNGLHARPGRSGAFNEVYED